MSNDLNTLSGALLEMKDQLIYELAQKGVTASYSSTGLLGLIGEISNIQTGGSCYHIAFDNNSYTASGGSVTVSCTLQENYALKSGATVTFSATGISQTATTDSNGVATTTITGISSDLTLTCTYSNVSDTCTVTVSNVLFEDDCSSSSGLSGYGNNHLVYGFAGSLTMTYDSNKNAYKVVGNGQENYVAIPIPTLDGKDNYYIEAEFWTDYNNTRMQSGIVLYEANDTGNNGVFYRDIANINRCGVIKFTNGSMSEAGNSQQSSLPVANAWYKLRLEIDGTSTTAKWMKTDNTLVYSYSYTTPSYTTRRVGICFQSWNQNYYVRNIKAEAL